MEQPPHDPLLNAVSLFLLFASTVVWLVIARRWWRGQALVDYESRTPVPWGFPAAMLAVIFVALALLTPAAAEAEVPDPKDAADATQRLLAFVMSQCVVTSGVVLFVAIAYRPSLTDFGLPPYADQLAADVRLGIATGLAALVPVYAVQALLLEIFGPSNHPLVEIMESGQPSVELLLLGTFAVVVVGPIGEEIFFRLLLQGWLEKWEDRRRGLSAAGQVADDKMTNGVISNDEARMTNDEVGISSNDIDRSPDSEFDFRHSLFHRLPHGWLPIIISSVLFGLAHFGYGPDPVAIFVLALMLGHIYQRTHRIVPCIVAHAVFNSIAIFVLWRVVFANLE